VLTIDQRHFTTYFQAHEDKSAYASTRFNFQEGYLSQLNWDAQSRMLEKISLLHYAGSGKPWKLPLTAKFRPSTALWHWHRTEATSLLEA